VARALLAKVPVAPKGEQGAAALVAVSLFVAVVLTLAERQ